MTRATESPANNTNNLANNHPKPWIGLFFHSLIGVIFMLINLPELLHKVTLTFLVESQNSLLKNVGSLLDSLIIQTEQSLEKLVGADPFMTFQNLLVYTFIAISGYFILLTLFALRHKKLSFLALGLTSFGVGVGSTHVISWGIVIALMLLQLVMIFIGFLKTILSYFTAFLTLILSTIILFLWQYSFWVALVIGLLTLAYMIKNGFFRAIVAAILGIGLGIATYLFGEKILRWLLGMILVVIQTLQWLIGIILTPILKLLLYIATLLEPIIVLIMQYLFVFLKIGVVIILILGILSTLGHVFADQFKAAWLTGKGKKSLMLGTFSIGAALGLVFLTSMANVQLTNSIHKSWHKSWQVVGTTINLPTNQNQVAEAKIMTAFTLLMYPDVKNFCLKYLTSATTPIIDTALLLFVIMLSSMSLLRHLVPQLDTSVEENLLFLPHEWLMIFGPLLLSVAVIFIQQIAKGESEG